MAEIIEAIENYGLSKRTHKKGTLSKVGVIGCGTMGQEIVLEISKNGIDVVFIDLSENRIKEAFQSIENELDSMINRWGLTNSEKRAILNRIKGSLDYSDIADCQLVIEAINTKKAGTSKEIRQDVFKKVEAVVDADAIICSNTATMMISDLSSVLKNPERGIGLHFLNPVDKINIVEVVKGAKTSEEAFEFVCKFAKMVRKQAISVNESPGNIHTRMVVPMINEACNILMEGIATVSDIDTTMKEASGNQFGPFEMADRIGLDKLLRWMNNLYEEFGELRFKPSPIIKRLVRANHLGLQTGIGFYKYENGVATQQTVSCAEIK